MSQASSSKGKNTRPLQPTSLVDESVEYISRLNEKQEMLDLLKRNNSEGVFVLSIVGMGGMGKTTLAQLVYNDASIKEFFDHKAWVCVSDDFDAINITKTVLKSIDPCSPIENDLNLLQVKLKEKLFGKRFLLVLDDIWNDSYNDWTILRSPFGAGTKIIVTTRHQKVSSNVDPVKAFQLDKLSHDDSLSIFAQHALKERNFDGHPELKEVGEKIVRRCDGLPLAAKAIGSLLRPVDGQVDFGEWEKIADSEIWALPEDQCGIVPALRLSYHHLPSHLRRCFAYCSILPKDYVFEEEEIILLWRAEGFLQQRDIGKQYFKDLVSRSFFQISSEDKSRFVMHDLINDLAQLVAGEICSKLEGDLAKLVAGEICSKLEGDEQDMLSNRTRHSSYLIGRCDTVKKFVAFDQANSLRTFLPLRMLSMYRDGYLTNFVLDYLLPRLGSLRVLSLCGYNITELPDDVFENMKHLRYLNFSQTKIRCLPDSLCTLYHLETLLLKWCTKLQKLPSKMEDLVHLHYLDIRGADEIKRMPFGIEKLINLERLSDFVIAEGHGRRIGELGNLSNLRGDFSLKGLENVNGQDAAGAKLNDKPGINRLVLRWCRDFEKATRKKEVEEQVLDSLRPREKLEQLVIENYGGAKFSTWMADSSFNKLTSLKLRNCRNCKLLPSIGRLSLLKHLLVDGLDGVHKVGVELFGESKSKVFASLETLCFESMPNWEEWDVCEGDEQASRFPNLRELSIKRCPQLLGRLPTRLQSLKKLEIHYCKRLVVSLSSFPSLRELSVRGCGELLDECCSSSNSPAVAEENTCLQMVTLSDISKFSIPAEKIKSRFANSEYLNIIGDKELECLSQNGLGLVGHHFTFLTEMILEKCRGLVCWTESNFPPALKKLVIRSCKNLEYLVDEKDNKKSMRSDSTFLLQHLEIAWCSSLISLSSRADIFNGLLHLQIWSCSKLGTLFSNAKLPVSLKHLRIEYCRMLECITQDFHETTHLESIYLSNAENLKSLPRGLDKLNHLGEINIDWCPNLVSLEESGLPWTTKDLRVLDINSCSKFVGLPKCINNFTSLHELTLWKCSIEISFPGEGFPTSLAGLAILDAPKIYTSLVQWGLHRLTSLTGLSIGGKGCPNVVSFPEQGIGMTLPPSLTYIYISNFENLEFMCSDGFQHLTFLHTLTINDCPKLKSLPEKDMLLSLGTLEINDCPLLKERCSRRGKGREWSKIAHIPHVNIDYKDVIPRGELD